MRKAFKNAEEERDEWAKKNPAKAKESLIELNNDEEEYENEKHANKDEGTDEERKEESTDKEHEEKSITKEHEGSDAEEEPSTTAPSGQAARQKLVRTLVRGV